MTKLQIAFITGFWFIFLFGSYDGNPKKTKEPNPTQNQTIIPAPSLVTKEVIITYPPIEIPKSTVKPQSVLEPSNLLSVFLVGGIILLWKDNKNH